MVMIPENIQIPKLGDMPKSEPVPEAIYNLKLEKADMAESKGGKNPGTPYVSCQFVITGPEEKEEFVGRKLFENFMLSGDGLFRLRNLLEATGEDEDFELTETDQLLDREVAAAVGVEKERTEGGRTFAPRNNIKRFMALGA